MIVGFVVVLVGLVLFYYALTGTNLLKAFQQALGGGKAHG